MSILGAKVVVTGTTDAKVKAVAKECEDLSPYKLKPLEVVADLTKSDDLNRVIAETVKTFGRLDVLVNNAGIRSQLTTILQTDVMKAWDQLYSLDLRAVVELTHVAVPHLLKTNGSIIQISALAGLAPMPQNLVYGPAKAGLDMLTRVLALELGPKGIRVNAINPGATQVFEPLPPIWEKTREFTPLKKLGQPLDIAKAVAFLISSDAQFITGANLVVDGGFVYNVGALNQLFQ
ncbi:unnamed protein product [Oppiella nova]|uniref:Uncharacterized protein n=1 Tax=Oppiella nova TaxID=334625 RepID=A0A7R9QPL8_9ACAR|nr:unnamed protein product [Oppiella nova]CAG2170771.1 unnamed protein product [Oppiella nova]